MHNYMAFLKWQLMYLEEKKDHVWMIDPVVRMVPAKMNM